MKDLTVIKFMRSRLAQWLAPPAFAEDEGKTRRASFLNVVIIAALADASLTALALLFQGGKITNIIILDILGVVLLLWMRRWLQQGKISLVGILLTVGIFIFLTVVGANLGTVRTPTTASYVFIVFLAGVLFDWRGIIVSTLASSLAVLGLILAQNAGLLPQPDYTATFIQWYGYTALFGITGGLAFFALQTIQRALAQAEKEIAERKRMEMDLRKLTQAVEQSPVSIVITDLQGNIEYVNPRFTQVTGYRPDEAIGKNPRILKTDQTPPEAHRQLWESITAGSEWHGEFVNRKKDGSLYYESALISPITDPNGIITNYLAVKEDITERKQVEKTLRDSEERFRRMFEDHRAVMLLIEPDTGQILDANTSAQEFYGYSRSVLKAMTIAEINTLPPDEIARDLQSAAQQELNYFVSPHRMANGEIRSVEIHSSPLNFNGKPVLFSIIHDMTARKQMEDALLESESRFRILIEQAPVGIAIDRSGVILYANPEHLRLFGETSAEDVVGRSVADCFAPSHREMIMERVHRRTHGLSVQPKYEAVMLRRDGSEFLAEVLVSPVNLADGPAVIAFTIDITERKQAENALQKAYQQLHVQLTEIEQLQAELREQALRDPLTGLYNRRYLSEAIEREIARARRENAPLSVIISDVDTFKRINDTYGHQAGDQFLVEVASLMKNNARVSDIVCRYGGEEFLLVLPGTGADAARQRAEKIRRKCSELVVQYSGQDLQVTISFGVATFPLHGQDAEAVIIKADKALYRSKHTGRNRVTVWDESAES